MGKCFAKRLRINDLVVWKSAKNITFKRASLRARWGTQKSGKIVRWGLIQTLGWAFDFIRERNRAQRQN